MEEEKREKFYHPNFVIDNEEDSIFYAEPLSSYDTDEDESELNEQPDIEENSEDAVNFSEYGFSKSTLSKFDSQGKKGEILNFEEAVKTDIPFITYEVENAAAIEDLGYSAFPIRTKLEISLLSDRLTSVKGLEDKCFVLAMGNTNVGKQGQAILSNALEDLGIDYIALSFANSESISSRYKKDKKELGKNLLTIQGKARQHIERTKAKREQAELEAEEREKRLFPSVNCLLNVFVNDKETDERKLLTGIKAFDKETGGLSDGLIIIGAESSLGKTSLCVQLGDNFTEQGYNVVYLNLEMPNEQLLAKSISRLMYQQGGLQGAVEYDKLHCPSERKKFNEKQKQAYRQALETYQKKYADKIILLGRDFSPNKKPFEIESLKEYMDMYVKKFGDRFVLIADYIQLLADRKGGTDGKRNIDMTVDGLKDIAYKYRVPVIGVTSFNRGSYTEQLSMSSAYGSSRIEYSADYILGLQLAGMDFIDSDVKESARKLRITKLKNETEELKKDPANDIELELKVLKARNKTQFTVPLKAKLAYGYFQSADNEKPTPRKKSIAKTDTTVKSQSTKKSVPTQESNRPDPFVWQ